MKILKNLCLINNKKINIVISICLQTFCFIMFISCSNSYLKIDQMSTFPHYNLKYNLIDRDGTSLLTRKAGKSSKNTFLLKQKIISQTNSKVLEERASSSRIGKYKNTLMFFPDRSIFKVWFDKKKYISITKILTKEKSLALKLMSPIEKYNGSSKIKFPITKISMCYFNQIIECAFINGFIKKAIKLKNGVMNTLIIFTSYPYNKMMYEDIGNDIFLKAKLVYYGYTNNEYKFSLDIGNQKIIYYIDLKHATFSKMFWVAQGLSIVRVQ